MSQLADIHNGVATALERHITRPVNVAAFPYSAKPLHRIEVWPAEDYYDPYEESDALDGTVAVNLRLRVDIDTADAETAFRVMTDLLGWETGSIRYALEYDRKLGGACDDLFVSGVVQWETDPQTAAQGGWVPVTVYVQKEN